MTNRAVITLNPSSGLPRDEVVNRIHYDVITTPALARATVNLAIETFFDTVDIYLSALILQTGHVVTHYNLDDPPPRVPQGEFTFSFNSAPGVNRLPGEVAVVMSSRAAAISGVNPGSLRNRFYLGPISRDIVAVTGLIDSTVTAAFANALQTMWNSINASGEAEAVVYSDTLATAYPIQTCWVNNEFDTQRRRGRVETLCESRGVTGA